MKTTHTPKMPRLLSRGLPALLLATLLVPAAAPSMRAAPLATDNFDSYTAGATAIGGAGGAGWSAAWTGQSAYANIVSGPANTITYTLDNGEVRGGGNALKITAPSEAETVGVLERAVPEITDGGDVFVSLVFKIKSGSASNPDQFDGSTFTTNNNVYYYAGDGAKSTTNDAAGFAGYAGKAGARLAGGWLYVNNSLVVNQTYLLVIRYSGWNTGVQAYDTITTWLNPTTNDEGKGTTSGNSTSNDNTVAITREGNSAGYGSTKFSSLYLNTLGLNAESRFHIIDDIRVGRSWADVVGIPMPVVTSITPSSVMAGDPVIIAGGNLSDASVTIGGIAAAITSQSAASLTVTVPASLGIGEQQVVVTGPGGSVARTLTIIRPPVLDSATPGSGVGGDTVVLAGRNLEESAVTIGGLPAAIVSNNGTELAIVIPEGLATGAQTITVSNNAGVATIPFANTAPTPPAPVVNGIDPPAARAGASVTLFGSALAGAVSVTVGGIEAEITSRANDALTITIPAGLANGDYPVVITTAAGGTSTTITLTDLIAADDFDTCAPGTPLAGAAGGTGWAGAWAARAGVTITTDPADAVTYTQSDGTVRGGGPALKLALDTTTRAAFPRVIERDLARPVTS
ncbi:MAG: IPT/TIG domain-containing protein, partial [Opitutaceae bacterium]|nr:IPT/TIG domain-containing protein [Opitutaceae bacterium]